VSPAPDFFEILRCLCLHNVDFIVVGGVSAVLSGAPLNTFDIDIVHSRELANIDRLQRALHDLCAIYRFQPERRLVPSVSHLVSAGHQLLMTKFGPLDVLGTIGRSRSYVDLVPGSVRVELDPDVTIYILGLETQILVKEEVGAPKDLAVLPLLRRTLQEKQEQEKKEAERKRLTP
jgi:hypothetical protein